MKIKDINLNHFTIKLERKRTDGILGKISIKSKEEFAKKYKYLLLDYDFQTELWINNAAQHKNISVSDLTDKEQISIKQSIVAKLNKGLKLQKNSISKTTVAESIADDDFDFDELDIVEEITPKQTNGLNLQDDFDFEDDVLSKDFNNEETLVNAKHLNEEFDFSEFDDVITSNFEEILEQDTPVKARSIDEMLASLVDSRQKLNDSYQAISKLLEEIKRVEDNHKSIEATVDDLERELFKTLQNKFK
ncbi:hypothetical protein SOX05_08690 [Pseudomonas putida]|nr:hypothetical protein [Pseudomonas putida]MDY4319338.1 hypothetical protein [Pseudomonas putida]MDY4352723.1 hypothetical protein [Pseudomonas putida]